MNLNAAIKKAQDKGLIRKSGSELTEADQARLAEINKEKSKNISDKIDSFNSDYARLFGGVK